MAYKIKKKKKVKKDKFIVENEKQQTTAEYIVKLSKSKITNESDDKKFQIILRNLDYDNAVVTSGIVYLEGHGTTENPPRSIQQVAGILANSFSELEEGY